MSKSESVRLDNKNKKELINLLDIALSTHHLWRDRKPDGLDEHFDAFNKKIRELSDKVWFQYIDWKDQAMKEGIRKAKKIGLSLLINIRNLGVQKGLMQFCDNPTKKQKKYEDVKFLFKGLKNNLNLKVVNYEDPNKKASRREQFNKILKVPTDV